MESHVFKKILTGYHCPPSGVRFVLIFSFITIVSPLFAGPLSDLAKINDLPPLKDVSAGDSHAEHAKISK